MFANERIKWHMDGSLQIDKLQIADGGNYTCIVANHIGQDQVTYTVVPEGVIIYQFRNV